MIDHPAKPIRFALNFCLLILCLWMSACQRHDIKLEVVHHTSDQLECDRVFAESRKAIIELNEILIQTGALDSNDHMVRACIIHVGGKEVVLKLERSAKQDTDKIEEFAGEGYALKLTYHPQQAGTDTVYLGKAHISYGAEVTDMAVEGVRNRL
ncbi:hypothetical protein LLH06_05520 [Mucilaginibacter daejeonensis]|uniref:hypothetical protein n=1 Tax=Mucilaginibacter daejeonensis TaxID=398049 RepID=UPI001D17B80F|nr:hypothetical protein [Mucilaginibacter daejeonensis]UEG54424.1 hypothetical protein LLH06_05520 [Mucilaginibacter daejeonensis]